MPNDELNEVRAQPEIIEKILVVEPGEFLRHRIRAVLRAPHRQVHGAGSLHEALQLLHRIQPDLILASLQLPEAPGGRALDALHQRGGGAPVVALAGDPTVDGAVDAMRHGAADYLPLVGDNAEQLNRAADRALADARSRRQLERVKDQVKDQYGFNQLLTQSPRMLEVFDQIRAVAETDATVLILGETGTGKELVSRAIHERSQRRERPFISVNCGAFTESLLESELFGHEKGSFTGAVGRREGLFEMADGGTLFLDELGETTLNVQVNLLRVLEEMCFRRVGGRDAIRVDVRIVAATNVHLEKAVRDGSFRQDLYYRLNVFPIRLPPMRERREDIPLLMRHFLEEIGAEYGLEAPVVAPAAMSAILAYHWPGNVRQLRAMCERWVITRPGQRLEREHLPADMTGGEPVSVSGSPSVQVDEEASLKENLARVMEQVERDYLNRVLQRNKGHLGNTADAAGVTRRTLYTKLKQYGLDARDFK